MQKRIAVIGMGRFGASVAKVLADEEQDVLAIDANPELVEVVAHFCSRVVRADTTDVGALRKLKIWEYDPVVVAIGDNVEASVITCLNCRDLGVKTLVAKAQDDQHGRVLERIGVDRVVYPHRDMGARVAHNISAGGIIDFIRLSEQYGMAEVEASALLVGRSLAELELGNRLGLNVMAIKRGKRVIVSPGADERIAQDDLLVVIGDAAGIDRLQEGK